MNPAELFEANLELIDRVVATVCRRARMYGADAEDFASSARVMLMDDDYAVLRRYERRSTLAAYLSVVIQRFLLDQRTHARGRWHASREAERIGPAGVLLETLLHRDKRSLDEALPLVRQLDPTLTRERAAELAARLPQRATRPQVVDLDDVTVAASELADDRAVASEQRRVATHTSSVIRDALATLSPEDRAIIRFRFVSELSVADISRMLRIPQRPLYRRLELLLQQLGRALKSAGIDARDVAELIGSTAGEMDFGLDERKSGEARQSNYGEGHAAGERP